MSKKIRKRKPEIYWAGFIRGKPIPVLWREERTAKLVYKDVRPVKIVEVKK